MKALVAICMMLCPAFLVADTKDEDRFNIELGVFLLSFETRVRLDSETLGIGTEINFEDELGLRSDQDNFRLDGAFRIARKHRLEFGYTSWSRDSTRVIDTEIQFGDQIYPVDATIRTVNDTDVYKLAYKYSFVNGKRFEAGISGGLSVFDFSSSLDAVAGAGEAGFESEELVAPVPLLGGFFDWKINPKLVLRTSAEFFDLSGGGWNGNMSDLRGTVNWYPFRNVGFGAGFNRVSLNYLEEGPPELEVKYVYSGIMVYVSFSF